MSGEGVVGPDSVLRRVLSERLVGLSALRVLLMQAAHPLTFVGFFAHTSALDDPQERRRRTTLIMSTIAFGTRERAERASARVRAMHERVRGALTEPLGHRPAGTLYAADQPELLLWVLATMAEGSAPTYRRWVGSLSPDELDHLWRDYIEVGRLFGLAPADMPFSWGEFEDYWDGMHASWDLLVTPEARELALDIVLKSPLPAAARPVGELVNQIRIGSLPSQVRQLYGFG